MAGASLLGALFGEASCRAPFDCTLTIDQTGGILLWIAAMVYMLKALARVAEEYFMPALERIVGRLKISKDIGGATFLALGSSGPEFCASLITTFIIVNEGGIGVIIGSAIFNLLVTNGIIGYFGCREGRLSIWWYPLLRDFFFYLIAIIELRMFIADGEVAADEGLIMVATYVVYCIYMKLNRRIMKCMAIQDPDEPEEEDTGYHKWGRCPNGSHRLEPVVAYEAGACDRCGKVVKEREVVLECDRCEPPWWMCGLCFEQQRRAEIAELRQKQLLGEAAPAEDSEPAPAAAVEDNVGLPIEGEAAPEAPEVDAEQQPLTAEEGENLPGQVSDPASAAPPGGKAKSDELQPGQAPAAVGSAVLVRSTSGKPQQCTVVDMDSMRIKVRYAAVAAGWKREKAQQDDEWLPSDSSRILKVLESEEKGEKKGIKSLLAECCSHLRGGSDTLAESQQEDGEEEQESSAEAKTDQGEEWHGIFPLLKDPLALLWELIMPSVRRRYWSLLILSIAFIFGCTYLAMDAAIRAGEIFTLPPRVMGLLVVAAGTSLPDAIGSVAVAKDGDGGIAVANALGSSVFDILIGLGLPWTLRCWSTGEVVNLASYKDALLLDITILIAVVVVVMFCLFLHGWHITRRVGIMLMALHFVYVVFILVSDATGMVDQEVAA